MGKATGDRASRRKRSIIIAKAQRKLRRIRETAAREGYSTARSESLKVLDSMVTKDKDA